MILTYLKLKQTEPRKTKYITYYNYPSCDVTIEKAHNCSGQQISSLSIRTHAERQQTVPHKQHVFLKLDKKCKLRFVA